MKRKIKSLSQLCLVIGLLCNLNTSALLAKALDVAAHEQVQSGQRSEFDMKWNALFDFLVNQDSLKWRAIDDFLLQNLEMYLPICGANDKLERLMVIKDTVGAGAREELGRIMESLNGEVETLNGYYANNLEISEKAMFESVIPAYYETVTTWFVAAYVGEDVEAPARCDKIIGAANYTIAKAERLSVTGN